MIYDSRDAQKQPCTYRKLYYRKLEVRSVIVAIKANSNLGLKHSRFYSHRLVKDILDLDTADGVMRVSMAHYNTGKS
jgi:hypothetical protein